MATGHRGLAAHDFAVKSFLFQLLHPSINELLGRITRLSTDCSVEEIHQTRVLIRVLLAHLGTFGRLLNKQKARDLVRQLKWLDSILAPLRDADVTMGLLLNDLDRVGSSTENTEDLKLVLIHQLTYKREVQAAALPELLLSRRMLRLTSTLRHWTGDLPIRRKVIASSTQCHLILVRKCLKQSRHKLNRMAMKAARSPSRQRLHRVRIQAKTVQYSFAAAKSLGVVNGTKTISFAGKLHKLLGRNQDLTMLTHWLDMQRPTSDIHRGVRRRWLQDIRKERKEAVSRYKRLLETQLF